MNKDIYKQNLQNAYHENFTETMSRQNYSINQKTTISERANLPIVKLPKTATEISLTETNINTVNQFVNGYIFDNKLKDLLSSDFKNKEYKFSKDNTINKNLIVLLELQKMFKNSDIQKKLSKFFWDYKKYSKGEISNFEIVSNIAKQVLLTAFNCCDSIAYPHQYLNPAMLDVNMLHENYSLDKLFTSKPQNTNAESILLQNFNKNNFLEGVSSKLETDIKDYISSNIHNKIFSLTTNLRYSVLPESFPLVLNMVYNAILKETADKDKNKALINVSDNFKQIFDNTKNSVTLKISSRRALLKALNKIEILNNSINKDVDKKTTGTITDNYVRLLSSDNKVKLLQDKVKSLENLNSIDFFKYTNLFKEERQKIIDSCKKLDEETELYFHKELNFLLEKMEENVYKIIDNYRQSQNPDYGKKISDTIQSCKAELESSDINLIAKNNILLTLDILNEGSFSPTPLLHTSYVKKHSKKNIENINEN